MSDPYVRRPPADATSRRWFLPFGEWTRPEQVVYIAIAFAVLVALLVVLPDRVSAWQSVALLMGGLMLAAFYQWGVTVRHRRHSNVNG